MTNLQDFSLINQRVKDIKDRYECESLGEAFDRLSLQVILKLSNDEIENALTDGPMDEGVDAIFVSDKDIHLFSCKYAESFQNSQRNFPEDAMEKMMTGIKRIMEKRIEKSTVNDALWENVQIIWSAIEKGPMNLIIHFVSNKETPIDHAIQKFQRDISEYRNFDVLFWDAKRLADYIIGQKVSKINGNLKLIGRQYFDRSEGNIRGIVAPVAAIDLLTLISHEGKIGHLKEDAFNDNIRIYYSLSNKINREIHDTALSEENYNFYYLNNGITIVCEELAYTPGNSPILNMTNLQIVNGGQTTHALAQAYLKNPERIDDVFVLAKIFATKDKDLSDKIGEKTNRQTPISSRDLAANDDIQRKLEDEFYVLGYYYERKNKQHEDKKDKPVIDSELMGQLYLSYFLDKPSEARNQKSIIFGDSYEDIFNSNISAKNMLIPYQIYLPLEQMKKDIQRRKRNKEEVDENGAFLSRAVFHIVSAVKQIAVVRGINEFNLEELKPIIPEAIETVGEVVRIVSSERGGTYTHDKFFKERPTNKIISDFIIEKYSFNPGL